MEIILKRKKIMVFGDFDADGVTSTAILVSALQKLGATVSYRIPDREKDSHRLLPYHIDEIASLDWAAADIPIVEKLVSNE